MSGFECDYQRVEFPQVGQIHEPGVRVKSLQGRVLVVGVDGDMWKLLVLQKLNEVRGEEALPDAALAVEDKINLFLHGQILFGSALLDKAKAYPLLKEYHPDAIAQVEYVNFSKAPRVMDYHDYEIQLDEAFRFNPEDTLILRILLRNKTDQPIQYRPDGFSLRVGDRTYPQSISDANGTIPPHGEAPAYFAVTGTPNGGRNDLSLKSDFTVLIDRVETSTPAKPNK